MCHSQHEIETLKLNGLKNELNDSIGHLCRDEGGATDLGVSLLFLPVQEAIPSQLIFSLHEQE